MATYRFRNSITVEAATPENATEHFRQIAENRGLEYAEINFPLQDRQAAVFLSQDDNRVVCFPDDYLVLPSAKIAGLLGNHLRFDPKLFDALFEAVDGSDEPGSSADAEIIHAPCCPKAISDAEYRDGAIRAAIFMEHNVKDGSTPVKAENVAGDRGGLTKYGISKAAFPNVDIANLTYDQAVQIYAQNMWPDSKADLVPRPLSAILFDFRVTSGPKNAIRCLQRAVGVSDDGLWGPNTRAAAEAACSTTPKMLAATRLFTEKRIAFYQAIVKNDSSQAKFLNGWINRAVRSQNFAQALMHTLDIL